MGKDYQRTDRVADLVQRELAKILQHEMHDPRLKLVTITAVVVTRDLAHAKVFITQHKNEALIPLTLKVLRKAASHLRHLLAQRIELRIIPELHFIFDVSVIEGARLSALIDSAIASNDESNTD